MTDETLSLMRSMSNQTMEPPGRASPGRKFCGSFPGTQAVVRRKTGVPCSDASMTAIGHLPFDTASLTPILSAPVAGVKLPPSARRLLVGDGAPRLALEPR